MTVREILMGLGCEECNRSLNNAEVDMYVYSDFGSWSRVLCEHHMDFTDGKPHFGAKNLMEVVESLPIEEE